MDKKFMLLLLLITMYLFIVFIIKFWTGYILPKAEQAAEGGLFGIIGFWGCTGFGMYLGYKIVQKFKKK